MFDAEKRALIAKNDGLELCLLPKMANRHGLITGATGTGKTVTLQTLAETFSQMGTAVFAADIKGDLSGVALAGGNKESVVKRVDDFGLKQKGFAFQGFPVQFWDVFGEQGAPVRATIADMGPLLLSRLLQLNETQSAVLSVLFKISREEKLELVDLKDLSKLVQYAADNAARLSAVYGNLPTASLGAVQRGLTALEEDGAGQFFGEPSLRIEDLIRQEGEKGIINILSADKLMSAPRVYTTFLLWLLNKLFEALPEVGDPERPKLVFFFDEAHLLFDDAPKALLEKVEQVIRLIRSKGVGIYFITQSPGDIPDSVLGQLGNRVQHALRAYTPKDQKVLKAAAQSFRANPKFDTESAISELGTGEALVSLLDAKGAPQMVERAFILPPQGQLGPISEEKRRQMLEGSLGWRLYAEARDRESAYEKICAHEANNLSEKAQAAKEKADAQARKEEEKQRKEEERQRKEQERQEKETRRERERQTKYWVGMGKSLLPLAKQVFSIFTKKR